MSRPPPSASSGRPNCQFVDRLKDKALSFPGCNVFEVSESYTSKTCSECGAIDNKLGSKHVYACKNKHCRAFFDRDINGARNIWLKWATENRV